MKLRSIVVAILFVAAGAVAQDAPEPVLRTSVHVVQVSVVAQDGRGRPVTDLKREDFVLRDNGKPRDLSYFFLDTGGGPAPGAPQPPAAQPMFSNHLPDDSAGVTIFLLDALNTRFIDQAKAKEALLGYLADVNPRDRIAVLALGRSLTVLHDFTGDTKALIAEIRRHNSVTSPLLGPEAEASGAALGRIDEFVHSPDGRSSDSNIEARAAGTANAFVAIANHIAHLRGRKNLVWISGSFPIGIGLDADPTSDQARDRANFAPYLDRATRALNNADVAVYPVSMAGFQIDVRPPTSSDRPMGSGQERVRRPTRQDDGFVIGRDPAAGVALRMDPITNRNIDTMQFLANETGGKAFTGSKDLATAIQEATSDARTGYALGFQLPSDALDGKQHSLRLEVRRPGVKLRYRRSYVAEADPEPPTMAAAIANELTFSSVGLSATLRPLTAKPEGEFAAILYVDTKGLSIAERDGFAQGEIDVLMIEGSAKKASADKPARGKIRLAKADWEKAQRDGIPLTFQVHFPHGGELHFAMRDVPSGAVGTLHLERR